MRQPSCCTPSKLVLTSPISTRLQAMMQEALDEAQRMAEEEEKSSNGSDDSSSSSDSDASSFGVVAEESSDEKAVRGGRNVKKPASKAASSAPKGKARRTSDVSPSVTSTRQSDAPRTRCKGKTTPQEKQAKIDLGKLETAVDAGSKYLASLNEMRPEVLWRSLIRIGEVDRRLGREQSVVNAIEAALSADNLPVGQVDEARRLITTIKSTARLAIDLKEAIRNVRTSKPSQFVTEVRDENGSLVSILKAEGFRAGKALVSDLVTLGDILVFIAKKLQEEAWLSLWRCHGYF